MKNNHNIVYLSLGSNLRLPSYRNAMKVIDSLKKKIYKSGLRITKSSNYWLTYPVPFSNIPKFINCVVKCVIVSKKANNAVILLEYLKSLENMNISIVAQKGAAKAYVWEIFLPAPKFRQEAVSGAKKPKVVNLFVLVFESLAGVLKKNRQGDPLHS